MDQHFAVTQRGTKAVGVPKIAGYRFGGKTFQVIESARGPDQKMQPRALRGKGASHMAANEAGCSCQEDIHG
jgi:hypothetical protein